MQIHFKKQKKKNTTLVIKKLPLPEKNTFNNTPYFKNHSDFNNFSENQFLGQLKYTQPSHFSGLKSSIYSFFGDIFHLFSFF
jgi:hypothetical protein